MKNIALHGESLLQRRVISRLAALKLIKYDTFIEIVAKNH